MVQLWTLWVTPNKGYGPQFGETAYISEVNRTRKIKSDAPVAMNKISDPCRNIFPWGWLRGECPQLKFSKLLKLSETSRARKAHIRESG